VAGHPSGGFAYVESAFVAVFGGDFYAFSFEGDELGVEFSEASFAGGLAVVAGCAAELGVFFVALEGADVLAVWS